MDALPVLPSALVQLSVTCKTVAPANVVGGVTASTVGSVVVAVQTPPPRAVPPVRSQAEGTPVMVSATGAPGSVDGFVSARLISSPATPAGARLLNCAVVMVV